MFLLRQVTSFSKIVFRILSWSCDLNVSGGFIDCAYLNPLHHLSPSPGSSPFLVNGASVLWVLWETKRWRSCLGLLGSRKRLFYHSLQCSWWFRAAHEMLSHPHHHRPYASLSTSSGKIDPTGIKQFLSLFLPLHIQNMF